MFYKGISTPRNKELMRILADLNYVEQTGHGIPNVIKVYGKKIFDINEKYINVIIPFDKEVLLNHQNNFYKQTLDLNCPSLNENVGVNVGVKLNKTQSKIVELLRNNPNSTIEEMAKYTDHDTEIIFMIPCDMDLEAKGRLKNNLPNHMKVSVWEEPFFPDDFFPAIS